MMRLPLLPLPLADFDRRGFRTDCPPARTSLQRCASAFIAGYNLAATNTSTEVLHDRLAGQSPELAGFGYEGAGMCASIADTLTLGRSGRLASLLTGVGHDYRHLILVGSGWTLSITRSTWVPRLPRLERQPMLRWLALDGAGFGAVFFGGEQRLRRLTRCPDSPAARSRLAGAGRALWFLQSADAAGIGRVIAAQPEPAQGQLWAGVGLASGYAGATDAAGLQQLAEGSGRFHAHLAQGVLFAAAARHSAGVIPAHTQLACREILGMDAAAATDWTDRAAADLIERDDVAAYDLWRQRLTDRTARLVGRL